MSKHNDGGPAFARSAAWASATNVSVSQDGMSLRDYFAAKALAAMIGHESKDHTNRGKWAVPTLAKFAYEYADAMLAAREAQS